MVALAEISCAEGKAKNLRGRRVRCVKNCGYRYDAETDNYYVRNRYYSPILGRRLTRDQIGYQGGINLYAYVESSPVGNLDAEGLAVYTYGVPLDNTPNGPAPLEVWHDAGALSMWDQFVTAGGGPIVIAGKSFLSAVEGSWELRQEESQYRARLLEKVKAAAKKLKPGQSTTVRLDVKDFTYTMPGSKYNPFGRFLGFGEIHVNIDGSANVRKEPAGRSSTTELSISTASTVINGERSRVLPRTIRRIGSALWPKKWARPSTRIGIGPSRSTGG